MSTTELLLIRHGESEANAGLTDHPDSRLTERGREQARSLARWLVSHDLRDFTGLVSPYSRARQTAGEITAVTGLPFAVEEMIREWGDIATIEGIEYPKETPAHLIVRLNEFLRRYRGRKLIVVSHAAPIAILTQLAWNETPVTKGQFWAAVNNCAPRWLRSFG